MHPGISLGSSPASHQVLLPSPPPLFPVPGQLVQRHLVQRHLVQDTWYKRRMVQRALGPKDTWYKGQKVQRQMVQSDTWYNRQKVQCFVKPDKRSKRQKVQSDKIFKIFFFFTKKDFRSDKKFKIFLFFTKNDFLCSWTIKLYLCAFIFRNQHGNKNNISPMLGKT